jgi:hypothetical protein
MSRLGLIGGKWTDTDDSGNDIRTVEEMRRVPKYFPFNRWYLEQWMPPESPCYPHPVIWEETMFEKELGPFPYRGEYEMAWKMETKDGQFISIQDVAVIAPDIVRDILAAERFSKSDNNIAVMDGLKRRDKEWDSFADSVLDDTNTFEGKPHIYMPSGISRVSVGLPIFARKGAL